MVARMAVSLCLPACTPSGSPSSVFHWVNRFVLLFLDFFPPVVTYCLKTGSELWKATVFLLLQLLFSGNLAQ